MLNLDNWKEVTRGLYRYVIAASVCYEIHIISWDTSTSIEEALCNLYIVGDWYINENNMFSRELLLENCLLVNCLTEAYRDNKENNT